MTHKSRTLTWFAHRARDDNDAVITDAVITDVVITDMVITDAVITGSRTGLEPHRALHRTHAS